MTGSIGPKEASMARSLIKLLCTFALSLMLDFLHVIFYVFLIAFAIKHGLVDISWLKDALQ